MIPERTVTDAATIIFLSSSNDSLLTELLKESVMIPVSDATLVTTAPTIIPRTGNGPN
jgi:hypothetical protein